MVNRVMDETRRHPKLFFQRQVVVGGQNLFRYKRRRELCRELRRSLLFFAPVRNKVCLGMATKFATKLATKICRTGNPFFGKPLAADGFMQNELPQFILLRAACTELQRSES